jgi:hypothetical protein
MLDGKGVGRTLMPEYFYALDAMTDEKRMRWVDEFADFADSIVQPGKDNNPRYMKARYDRNVAYSKWIAAFFVKDPATGECHGSLKGGLMKWQAIRVLSAAHTDTNSRDWWPNYRDCVFRVFLQPQTFYDHATGEHVQWYLLSPEDCYLVNRQEIIRKGGTPPTRDYADVERFLSADPNLRRARLIPVECCHHLRHEGNEHRLLL